MSATSAQLQFAAEFVLFLAAASGFAAVALRGYLLNRHLTGRLALATGCLCLAVASFLHGSEVVPEGDAKAVIVLRSVAVVALILGSVNGWAAGRASWLFLLGSIGFVSLGTFTDAGDAEDFASVALAIGGFCLGAVIVAASRRAIAARVAASAAVTLLIVVLLLGVALSAVLVNTVQEGAIERLENRVTNEADNVTRSYTPRLENANLLAASLASNSRVQAALPQLATAPSPSNVLASDLQTVAGLLPKNVGLLYLAASGRVHGAVNLDDATILAVTGSPVVEEAFLSAAERGAVDTGAGLALAIGVAPVRIAINGQASGVLGAAIAVAPVDNTFLDVAAADDDDLSLALMARGDVVAERGTPPPPDDVADMVDQALADSEPNSQTVGGRFVAVAPILAGDVPKLVMLGSTPTTLVAETRNELFRNLFLIALGGTLLALLLASYVGTRIGSGLERLRAAAEGIGRGDFTTRVEIATDDEVGALGRTIDSMAMSLQEKTATEAKLRNRLEGVVAGMGEALVAVDDNGFITDFNRAAEVLMGRTQAQSLGRHVDDVVRLEGEDGTLKEVVRLDGTRVPVAVSVGSLRGPRSEYGGQVLVLADLTREREVEQMKTEFLSRVGHELRTPLTPLMAYADMLLRRPVPPEQAKEMYEIMLAESKSLLRIVEMLEFFAATGAGRVPLRVEEIDPRSVVDDVVRRWQNRSEREDPIRHRVRKSTPKVMADRHRITKCLDELVDNAVKFSPNGGRILVSAEPSIDGGVEFTVSDQGIGMSAVEQRQAFSEFVQGDPGDTRRFGGLGLGLAYVRRVVEAHDGALTCDSELGRGSKFSIILPAVPMDGGR